MELLFINSVLFVVCVTFVYGKHTSRHNNTLPKENDRDLHDNPLSECHFKQPGASACVERAAARARGVLARGAPARGVPPLDPLAVPSLRLRQRAAPAGHFKYDAWLSDVILHGLTDFDFNKLNIDPEELKVTMNISLSHLAMFSNYVVLGEFQMLPVESTGRMMVNFNPSIRQELGLTAACTARIEAEGARVHRRVVVRDAAVRLRCAGDLRADLADSHSTTNEMEMITEHVARMHAHELARELAPALETALALVLEDAANKALRHVPADDLFPD